MKIQVLDCTLRDGGYCNNWEFGIENIKYIVNKLTDANIDIIEIGFLSHLKTVTTENSIFWHPDKIWSVLPKEKPQVQFVCMCNYGEVDFAKLESQKETKVDGIRLAFHKKDWRQALKAGEKIKKKGYTLYLQPMATMIYTDKELIDMINKVNEINPEAFYMVDSFGAVRKDDLLRMYYLINHSLNENIKIGYHSHNNMQLAYANTQCFIEIHDKREKIIDSSVFGMGRGAGNLNTELLVEHLNKYYNVKYNILPLLQIIDNVLNKMYVDQYWGYSLPHYLSSLYNCHPSYATYLSNKNTLSIESINDILKRISDTEKYNFNKEYIENIYFDYQSKEYDDYKEVSKLKKILKNRSIVILAPGRSLQKYSAEILTKIKELNAICLSVNFLPVNINVNMVFVSNQKRFEQFEQVFDVKCSELIYTSNVQIVPKRNSYCINYASIRNATSGVEDNAMLMLLNLLVKIGVSDIHIAGMDGYSEILSKNYFDASMVMKSDRQYLESMNHGIYTELKRITKLVAINWLTPSLFSAGSDTDKQ